MGGLGWQASASIMIDAANSNGRGEVNTDMAAA